MIKRYIDYLKDNPQGYWFKQKLFGWGWTPVTWQGWAVLGVYLGVILSIARRAEISAYSERDMLIWFGIPIAAATAVLLVVCYTKGEHPRWRWGFGVSDKTGL
jgi:hypothetical protein